MAEHTPTPWHTEPGDIPGTLSIRGPNGQAIASFGNQRRWLSTTEVVANAEFIVRACNAHDDLLAACKAAHRILTEDGSLEEIHKAVRQCELAIAKAEPKGD